MKEINPEESNLINYENKLSKNYVNLYIRLGILHRTQQK